jgi:CO/xanthine dehydrogenase Mo-binding subunit
MIDDREVTDFIEAERYELFAAPGYNFPVCRRDFIKTFGLGILFVVPLTRAFTQQPGESGRGGFNNNLPNDIGAWIHIDEKGVVTAFTGKVEFGQNIRTSLSQAVAEELHVPVESVRIVMGDTELTPFDMGTFGSRTTPTMAPQLRKAAAAAREMLIAMAAEELKLQPGDLRIVNARFENHDKSKTLTLAEVARGRKLVKVIPENIATTKASDWTIAGKSLTKVDAGDFVTGSHRYTSDFKREGMLYGKIVRPTTLNATLRSANTKAAEAISGVKVVVDGNFIGVTAPDPQTAVRAASLIAADWQSTEQPSNTELFDLLRKPAPAPEGRRGGDEGGGRGARPQGSIADGLAMADKKLAQTYTVEYIAHAPLEPRAAVAEWNGEKLTVWTGTQRPFGVRGELAEAFHISEDKVRVIVPDTGSGYGGKHTGECAVEAARLARAAGKPVKLVWTREEEFTWAYFRPAGVIDIKSGVKSDGTITAWEFHNYNSGSSGIQIKYDIPNHDIRFHQANSPLRQGSYRGLAATANHFARESHMDELADAVKMDPLEFRLKNIKDERLRDVLQAAAKTFGWGKTKPANGRGFGLACGFEKGSYIATCAEIAIEKEPREKDQAKVTIVRVVEAFECGAVVNPLHLKNQIEGAIVQAVGGALFEAIRFANGKILNARFAEYRVPRFSDTPLIEVVLVNRKDLPSAGAGETPIVGLAPAVSNAIFNATGVRLRALPLAPKGISFTPKA